MTGKPRADGRNPHGGYHPWKTNPAVKDIRRCACTGVGDLRERTGVRLSHRQRPCRELTDSVVQGHGVVLAAASQDDGLGQAAGRQLPLGLAWPSESSRHSYGTSTAPRREFQPAGWPLAAMGDSSGDASVLNRFGFICAQCKVCITFCHVQCTFNCSEARALRCSSGE